MRFSLARLGLSFERAALGLIAATVLALYIGVIGSQPWVIRTGDRVGSAVVALNWDLVSGAAPADSHGRGPGHDTLGSWAWLPFTLPNWMRDAGHAPAAAIPAVKTAAVNPVARPPADPSRAAIEERKAQFIRAIIEDRERIVRLRLREELGLRLDEKDRAWLGELHELYGMAASDYAELLRRHDVVPPSLALAQSIEESGWGTSRFAVQGNALFGRITETEGAGMVPANRDPDQTFEIRVFDAVEQSVADYVRNLNRHHAYRDFRREREAMRRRGGSLDSYTLAATLTRYSARREKYVQTIRSIIRSNDLTAYDNVRLADLGRWNSAAPAAGL
jgi:Bax protein